MYWPGTSEHVLRIKNINMQIIPSVLNKFLHHNGNYSNVENYVVKGSEKNSQQDGIPEVRIRIR
jgi:hypothetical protein